ncbi:hypothetical protein FB451DRAFT_1565306 [Mycena latifolia]|nr:hypothetical protein FB451DRAFT_1565306 [Mycena latifolia]
MRAPFSSPQHRVHPRRRNMRRTRPPAPRPCAPTSSPRPRHCRAHPQRRAHPRQRVLPVSARLRRHAHHLSTAPIPTPIPVSAISARPPARHITVHTAASTSSPQKAAPSPTKRIRKHLPVDQSPRRRRFAGAVGSERQGVPPIPLLLISRCDETRTCCADLAPKTRQPTPLATQSGRRCTIYTAGRARARWPAGFGAAAKGPTGGILLSSASRRGREDIWLEASLGRPDSLLASTMPKTSRGGIPDAARDAGCATVGGAVGAAPRARGRAE